MTAEFQQFIDRLQTWRRVANCIKYSHSCRLRLIDIKKVISIMSKAEKKAIDNGQFCSRRSGEAGKAYNTCLPFGLVKEWLEAGGIKDANKLGYKEAVDKLHELLKGNAEFCLIYPQVRFPSKIPTIEQRTAPFFKPLFSEEVWLSGDNLAPILNEFTESSGGKYATIFYALPMPGNSRILKQKKNEPDKEYQKRVAEYQGTKPKRKVKERDKQYETRVAQYKKELAARQGLLLSIQQYRNDFQTLIRNAYQAAGTEGIGIVLNTEANGVHWVVLWIDKKRNEIEFYDPQRGKTLKQERAYVHESINVILSAIFPPATFQVELELHRNEGKHGTIQEGEKSVKLDQEKKEKFAREVFENVPKKHEDFRILYSPLSGAVTVKGEDNVRFAKDTLAMIRKSLAKYFPLYELVPIVSYKATKHQQLDDACGFYAIWFLDQKMQGKTREEITNTVIYDAEMCAKKRDYFLTREDIAKYCKGIVPIPPPLPPIEKEPAGVKHVPADLGIYSVAVLTIPKDDRVPGAKYALPKSLLDRWWDYFASKGEKKDLPVTYRQKWERLITAKELDWTGKNTWTVKSGIEDSAKLDDLKEDTALYIKPYDSLKQIDRWLDDGDIRQIVLPYVRWQGKAGEDPVMEGTLAASDKVRTRTENKYHREAPQFIAAIFGLLSKHWVSAFMDRGDWDATKKQRTGKNRHIEFFDSQLNEMSGNLKKRVEVPGVSVVPVFDREVQEGGAQCGIFAAWFLIQRLRGYTLQEVQKMNINDLTCKELRKEYFRTREPRPEDLQIIEDIVPPPPLPPIDVLRPFDAVLKQAVQEWIFAKFDKTPVFANPLFTELHQSWKQLPDKERKALEKVALDQKDRLQKDMAKEDFRKDKEAEYQQIGFLLGLHGQRVLQLASDYINLIQKHRRKFKQYVKSIFEFLARDVYHLEVPFNARNAARLFKASARDILLPVPMKPAKHMGIFYGIPMKRRIYRLLKSRWPYRSIGRTAMVVMNDFVNDLYARFYTELRYLKRSHPKRKTVKVRDIKSVVEFVLRYEPVLRDKCLELANKVTST